VNISDIVAMGGMPKYALLSLSILEPEDSWLSKFAKGLRACAKKYNVELIGGDTNKGSPSISITIIGDVLKKNVLRRDQVQINDEIWLTSEVGYAALHFQYNNIPQKNRQTISNCLKKSAHESFVKPIPPLGFIQKAKSLIHSAIDLSDGLAGDLQHITLKNGFGAKIYIDKIPMHKWFRENNFYELALTGGEDYQILFTAPVKNNHKINSLLKKFSMKGAMIGHVSNKKSIQYELNGQPFHLSKDGFRHFG
jgi:thiamine-monophosphate kinase